jgi:selenocysteine-specific elongation factor
MNPPRTLVVGTAGHIDHGKSRLVLALTGIDPDRLKEEQERGITIDLGFAHLTLGNGTRVGFVDVPGHERFVRNMLAGVGGIDLVLLVIAADESIKPQTREHFDICRLLRIQRGLVVLTKADLVDADMLELVRLEVREFVAGSFLEGAPIVPVSSLTGAGLPDLRAALEEESGRLQARSEAGLPRLPIDRAFTIKGFGTVVTGTLLSGTLGTGQEVLLQPRGQAGRIRGLQVHGETVERATPGQRVAVNLQGIEVAAVERGDLLTEPGALEPTRLLDVTLELLPTAEAPLKDLARVGFHLMTVDSPARVKLVGGDVLAPGASAAAQLRMTRPVVALPGDRFILRRPSPAMTIAGGVVLHNAPAKLRGHAPALAARYQDLAAASSAGLLRLLVVEGGPAGVDAPTLRARTGLGHDAVVAGLEAEVRSGTVQALATAPRRFLDTAAADALGRGVVGILEDFHRREPLREGVPREEVRTRVFSHSHPDVFKAVLAALVARGAVRAEKEWIAVAGHQVSLSADEVRLVERMEQTYRQAGANPPELSEVARTMGVDSRRLERLVHLLLTRGRLTRIPDGKIFHAEALDDLKRRLRDWRARSPTIDIAEFKELSGTSRKHAIPLLEYFDQARVTQREGSRRRILALPGDAD